MIDPLDLGGVLSDRTAVNIVNKEGWHVSMLRQTSRGSWVAQLTSVHRLRETLGRPGHNDARTDYAEGPTIAAAVLAAACLRFDRETGCVVKVTLEEVRGYSENAEMRLEEALGRAVESFQASPVRREEPSWGPGFPLGVDRRLLASNLKSRDYYRLLDALEHAAEHLETEADLG